MGSKGSTRSSKSSSKSGPDITIFENSKEFENQVLLGKGLKFIPEYYILYIPPVGEKDEVSKDRVHGAYGSRLDTTSGIGRREWVRSVFEIEPNTRVYTQIRFHLKLTVPLYEIQNLQTEVHVLGDANIWKNTTKRRSRDIKAFARAYASSS